ncbi:TIGR03943 family putative permease subunit [Bacillus kexueae]|uniref:TIGR03943 family putative permease subunit n=1 Tax=Aeribacillus kexueae TaxID=2078952 RepID=UPI001FAF03BB|nr:TIGR03943 family protein [Bacillus kexueae]
MVQFHAYIRGVILIGFSLLLFKLVVTGHITKFIAPKMLPYSYFGLVTFFILGVIQILKGRSDQRHKASCGCEGHELPKTNKQSLLIYSLFVFPLVTGFMFPDVILDSSVALKRGFKQEIQKQANVAVANNDSEKSLADQYLEDPEAVLEMLEQEAQEQQTETESEAAISADEIQSYFEEQDLKRKQEILKQEVIRVNDDNFISVTRVLDQWSQEFAGKKIEYFGFVYREDDFETDQFVIARFGISCCAADASVYGTIASVKDAHKFKNDEWVRVEGTLSTTNYHGVQIPIILIDDIERAKQPKEPYVYELIDSIQIVE